MSEEWVDRFEQDGYLVLEGLLDPSRGPRSDQG